MPMFVEKYIASIDKSHTCRHYYFIGIRYVAPTIINTFLESYDLNGKTIIPFATSGGSGMGKTNEKLMPSCPGAKLSDGKVFASNINIAELNAWVESLKLYSE